MTPRIYGNRRILYPQPFDGDNKVYIYVLSSPRPSTSCEGFLLEVRSVANARPPILLKCPRLNVLRIRYF